MAYCIIESTNPEFSFILGKNPASGPIIKELRAGHLFGWFPNGQTDKYCMFFKDSEDEISYKDYKDQQFEYLNTSRYNSPDIPGRMIIEFFNSFLNKGSEKDIDGYENTFTIGAFRYSGAGYFQLLPKYFPDVEFHTEDISPKCQKVVIKTKKSIMYLMNLVSIISLLTSVKDDTEYVEVGTDRLRKLVNQISSLKPPYFMAYIFKSNLLNKRVDFEAFAPQLQESCFEEQVILAKGSNYIQRQDYVEQRLNQDMDVLDFGCGSGTYIGKFAKRFETYYALDHDEEELEKAKSLVKKKQLEETVIFINDLDGIAEDAKLQVILSEVIEHNKESKAVGIVKGLLDDDRVQRIIVTTPNKAFNKYYLLEEGETRHHDHVNEMTLSELSSFITKCVGNSENLFPEGSLLAGASQKWGFNVTGLGDKVNGEYTTFGLLFSRVQK